MRYFEGIVVLQFYRRTMDYTTFSDLNDAVRALMDPAAH